MDDRLYFMSDRQLRETLKSYGFANIPLTPSTRNVLVRKLLKRMRQTVSLQRPPATLRCLQPRQTSDDDGGESDDNTDCNESEKQTELIRNSGAVGRKYKTWMEGWILIGLVYICTHILTTKSSTFLDDENNVIPFCYHNLPGSIPGVNCVVSYQVGPAKDLMRILYPELITRAETFKCRKPGAFPYFTTREIYGIMSTRQETVEFHSRLRNLIVLLQHNPDWGFSVITVNYKYGEMSIVKDEEYNMDNIAITVHAVVSSPIFCLVFYPLHTSSHTLIRTALFFVVILALQRLRKFYMNCLDDYENKILNYLLHKRIGEGYEDILKFVNDVNSIVHDL